MAESRSRNAANFKTAVRIKAEEVSRQVIEEADALAAARALARAKARLENEISVAAAKEAAKTRESALAAKDAKIAASGKDEWFYLQDGNQFGPFCLAELRVKVADPSIAPPIQSVWTEGMDEWSPVYEVRMLYDTDPAPTGQTDAEAADQAMLAEKAEKAERLRQEKSAKTAAAKAKSEQDARSKAAAVAKAAEEMRLKAAAEAKAKQETDLRRAAEAKAEEQTKLKLAAEAKAAEEATLRAIAIATAAAEAKAAHDKAELESRQKAEEETRQRNLAEARAKEEARLRAAAEAKALEETNLRIAAEKKAAEEARLQALAEAKAIEEARVAAEAKALEETNLRIATATSAIAAQEAKTLAKAEAKVKAAENQKENEEEEAKTQAEIDALAAQEERVAALAIEKARAKAENKARAAELARIAAAAKSKIRKEARSQSIERARLKALAKKAATERAKAAETKSKETIETQVAAAAGIPKAKEPEAPAKPSPKELTIREVVATQGSPHPLPENTSDASSNLVIDAEPETISTREPETSTTKSAKKSKSSRTSSKSVWFYTCEGDRLGPITFEELKAMAAASSLDPRLDMVWKKGMAAWQTAGKTDGLFERVAAPTEKYKKPSTPVSSYRPAKNGSKTWTGASTPWPGARRRSLLFAILVFPIAWHFAMEFATPFFIRKFGEVLMGKILPFTAFLPLIVLICFAWKRLTNLGMSHWWIFAAIAPIINLWVGFRCLACPSGYACHKRLDGRGRALATVYWLLVLGGLSFIAATTAPLAGIAKVSDLPERVKSIIHSTGSQLSRSK